MSVIKLHSELTSQLTDVDKAYLAGLFDGEGCANPTLSSKKYKEVVDIDRYLSIYIGLDLAIAVKHTARALIPFSFEARASSFSFTEYDCYERCSCEDGHHC